MNVLVYHIGSLGDTLVAVPALWAIRDNFPDAHVTMLTDEQPGRVRVQVQDVLDGSGLIDDYMVYPAGKSLAMARLLLQLRAGKFDCLIYLIRAYATDRRCWRDTLFFKLAGIKRRIGMQKVGKPSTTRASLPLAPLPHMADTLLARLQTAGLKTPPAGQGRMNVGIGKREQDAVARWRSGLPDDGGRPWLAMGPGAKMPCKIWPAERYLAVAERLVAEYDFWPVIFGGPGEREVGEALIRKLGRGYLPAGVLGVRDSMAAMERCALFLGNDTGTMHMAAASGVRCVALFTSRQAPGVWYPYGDGHAVLRIRVHCEGCMLEDCVKEQMKCIQAISVEQVLQACQSLIKTC
jgi:ADP-heptose:LPS heptosyltransferase